MTAVAAPAPAAERLDATRQTAALAKRSIQAFVRQPALVIPSIVFPLFFAALGTSAFGRATALPGFPQVDSYLDFALAGSIVQGVLFGSVTGATALATDIETGFFDRLLAAPTARVSILLGRLAGAATYGAAQTVFFILVLLPFGLSIKSGVVGAAVMVVSGATIALGVGALMSGMALRTGSSEAVQGSFPLLFIFLFFSSAFFPRATMQGVFKAIANLNPVSYLVEGLRKLTIEPLNPAAIAEALLIPAAIAALGLAVSLHQLHRRVSRR